MTKEQLIREMIQVELLYRTKQQLKKNKLNESAPGGQSVSAQYSQPTPQSQTPPVNATTTTKNPNSFIIKNKSQLVATGVYEYYIGDNANEFIRNELSKIKIKLKREYVLSRIKGSNQQEKTPTITQLTYDQLDLDDRNTIWGLFEELLTKYFLFPSKASEKIVADLEKADTNPTCNPSGKVFGIFENYFPLCGLKYESNKDLNKIVAFLKEKKDEKLYKEIYKNKEKEGTFSTGKGEFLCVLLTKNATSGGSTELDVAIGTPPSVARAIKSGTVIPSVRVFYDVKQITNQNSDINFTFSSKSGVKTPRDKFLDMYAKLGLKIYDMKDELKNLYIDDDLLKTIDQFKGYVGKSFGNEATYEKLYKSGNQFINTQGQMSTPQSYGTSVTGIPITNKPPKTAIPPSYMAFKDITDALIQGLSTLRAKTFNNILAFNDITNQDFNNKYKNANFDLLNNNLIIDKTQNGNAAITYTPFNTSQNPRNIDQKIIDFLNSKYLLNLQSFDIIMKNNPVLLDKLKNNKYNNKDLFKFNVATSKNLSNGFFKYLDINNYNQIIEQIFKDILGNNYQKYAEYFKLDVPIIISPDNVTRSGSYFAAATNIQLDDYNELKTNYFGSNGIFQGDPEINKIFSELIQVEKKAKKGTTITDAGIGEFKSRWNSIVPIIMDLCNHQIVLSAEQAIKIANLISENQKNAASLRNNPPTNTKFMDNDLVVVEPLAPNIADGEFIIDISFYKNNRKRYIDTLHSQDFQISASTNDKLRKTDKESRISSFANKDTIKKVSVQLTDVISDKDLINQKLKKYNLFNAMQPAILEKLFSQSKYSGGLSQKISKNANVNNQKISYINVDNMIGTVQQGKKTKELKVLTLTPNQFNKDFINALKKTKETQDNFLTDLYDLYQYVDELENAIRKYYSTQNSVLVFKDQNDEYNDVYNWNVTFGSNYDEDVGFLTGINNIGMQCNGNLTVNDKGKLIKQQETIKQMIQNVFQQIFELMMDIQNEARK